MQGEFFTAAADLPERLVRESIQNSLDARRGEEMVEVRFAFGGAAHTLPKGAARPYVEGLERHLTALADARTAPGGGGGDEKEEEALFRAWELLEGPLKYLVVEDFGTTGLIGDPAANGEMESGNDFWGFFRSVGISPKPEDAAGSWGLGRWVFPDASGLNAYIGLTRSYEEETKLLMGLAMLKTHHVNDQKYPPYGFFAAPSDDSDENWLPMPVLPNGTGSDFIERFESDFYLRRGDEPGLSIVVPHPHEDLTPQALERAVVTQYFLPILRGDLRVLITSSDREAVIDRSTLAGAVHRMRGGSDDESARAQRDDETVEALSKAIRLARWAGDQEDHTELSFPVSKLRETVDALEVEELRRRFEANERLAFRLTMDVNRRKAARSERASFRVYLERADELTSGHSYFVRGHLRIPMAASTGRFRQARALIVVDGDTELGHLLRDAEGPAHATWDPHAQRLKDRWSGGYSRVQAVRGAAGLLLRRLTQQSQEPQIDALADLFPADPDPRGGPTPRPKPGPGPGPPDGPPPLPDRSKFRVSGLARGFVLRGSAANPPEPDSSWNLRVAYDVLRGGTSRAFRQFDSGLRQGCPDFSLEALVIDSNECSYEITAENSLRFVVRSNAFQLSVTGFDHRDVIVDVREAGDSDVAPDDSNGAIG
ncbi:MAG: hypothetical protein OXH70_14300 [Acidobacteria bacterium]|nr:hypothetical protein [Acidobacteriota bacterium]